jgi:hypothetical protein
VYFQLPSGKTKFTKFEGHETTSVFWDRPASDITNFRLIHSSLFLIEDVTMRSADVRPQTSEDSNQQLPSTSILPLV